MIIEEDLFKTYSINDDLIKTMKKKTIRMYLTAASIPLLLMLPLLFSKNELLRQSMIFSLCITIAILFFIFYVISKKKFNKYKNIKAIISDKELTYISSHDSMSFTLNIDDITNIIPKYKNSEIYCITILTPYTKVYIHSVEHLEILYQNLLNSLSFQKTRYNEEKTENRNVITLKVKKIIIYLFISLLALFSAYNLFLIRNKYEFDIFIELIKALAFLFIYLYFSITLIFKIAVLNLYKKKYKQFIFSLTLYLGLFVYILIKIGPILIKAIT